MYNKLSIKYVVLQLALCMWWEEGVCVCVCVCVCVVGGVCVCVHGGRRVCRGLSSVAFNCQRMSYESLGSIVSWDDTVRQNCVSGLPKLLVV